MRGGPPDLIRSNPRLAPRAWLTWLLAIVVAVLILVAGFAYSGTAVTPIAPTEIFAGITYGCKRLDVTQEGSGLVHWVALI